MPLSSDNQKLAGDFVNGLLWKEIKRVLFEREPESPSVKDEVHVAAAIGHKRAGYELAIAELEKIPFEHADEVPSPFDRPAVSITED
jgi:hypothetical protein